MKLDNILIKTGVAKSSMLVREAFKECVRYNVPGLPYLDGQGKLIGRISIRHILKVNCIPDYMVVNVDIMGDSLGCFNIPGHHALKLLDLPIDDYVMDHVVTITPNSPIVKTLALMEKADVTYLFVMDNGQYIGTVTIMGIAQRMLEIKDE